MVSEKEYSSINVGIIICSKTIIPVSNIIIFIVKMKNVSAQ